MWEDDVTEMQEGEFRESLQETDWAWLAGFLDGEGYFGIKRGYGKAKVAAKRGRYKPSKFDVPQDGWVWFSPRLVVNGTHLPSIELCAAMMQGKVMTRKPQRHSKMRLYGVEVSARKKLVNILPNILPYLVVKKGEAELMHEFVNLPQGTGVDKQRLFERMVILSQARPGTDKYTATEIAGASS